MTTPQAPSTLSVEGQIAQIVTAALDEAWSDYVSDANAFPGEFSITRGPKLWFRAGGNWTDMVAARIRAALQALAPEETDCHGLDTPDRVCFYEQDFYPLSNFSAFTLRWDGWRFDTSEAAYHWEKFKGTGHTAIMDMIRTAPSAHEAFKIAERSKTVRRSDWDEVKVSVMRDIVRSKAAQHEYVRRKLLATGDRELVENSWRDDFWGWGPNRDGQNILGKLWMEVRSELRAAPSPPFDEQALREEGGGE